MTEFIEATSKKQFNEIAQLAAVIWRDHYTPIIGREQVDYMIKNYQSAEAMYSQYLEGYHYYKVNYNQDFVGYMSIKRQEKSLFLSKIYVSKNYRGKKIGKTAMAFVEAKAMKMQCKSITLTVNKYNVNSIAAYETMGFKNMGEMITDIGEGFIMDDYKMEKLL